MPVFDILPELNIVQSITSWILYYYHQCKTSSFDNSISYGEQEIDFQFGTILPVKSCKFASLSYSFRAKRCEVYNLLNSLLLLSIQNQFFFHSLKVQQETEFWIGNTLSVKSCKISSLTYTSRAKTLCSLLPLEFYFRHIL